jgi:cholesterol transport system auxiliary component
MKPWQKPTVLVLLALNLSACMSLGEAGPAQQFYVLQDSRVNTAHSTVRPGSPTVLLNTSAGSPFYDSIRLAYSQQRGARAYYQFANWTTRPAVRLGQLLAQRINGQGKVNAAWHSSELQGDWLLELRVDEFYHDVSVAPGQARLVVLAELINRRSQQLKAARIFDVQSEVTTRDATGAVSGFQDATTQWLDQISAWVEQTLTPAS